MRNPEFAFRIEDFSGPHGTESMRQRLARSFGTKWQQKSVAEMLYEASQWGDESADKSSPVVSIGRQTLVALAVYAGIREDDYGD